MTKRRKKKKLKLNAGIRRFLRKTLLTIVAVMVPLMISGYIALRLLLKGPSQTFSELVVSTFWETRRGKAIVNLFYTDEDRDAILYKNTVNYDIPVTNTDNTEFVIPEDEKDKIEIIDIAGGTFKGKMMIVRDPSRIQLGVNVLMNDPSKGYSVEDYVQTSGAIAGINAGGFEDPNGQGDGSIPYKIVIKDEKLVAGKMSDYQTLIGFNKENHLIVGDMTGEQALEWGLTDAVTFGPVLVYDSHPVAVAGNGGGLNPRTVIGQTPDGSVLLLVIDGRQPNCIGASYEDCIKIMMEYGAVAAANLDGGSSSVMYYDGAIINSVVSMNGDRAVPTAWLVK